MKESFSVTIYVVSVKTSILRITSKNLSFTR